MKKIDRDPRTGQLRIDGKPVPPSSKSYDWKTGNGGRRGRPPTEERKRREENSADTDDVE